MKENIKRKSALKASNINRRSVLKGTAVGLAGVAGASGSASAVELFNTYYANSWIYLHHEPDTSTTFSRRKKYTGMRTINGPEYNDGYTWWKVEINGDYYNYKRRRAWVAEKDMSKSHFGYGSDCYFTSSHCDGRGHDGVDIACNGNHRDVFAAQAGHAHISERSGYGLTIEIYHDNDYSSLYAHLNRTYIDNHEDVEKGQKIALTGNTGDSSGIHLHQELRAGGTPLEWPHNSHDQYGNRIRMWRKTGIPQTWSYISC